MDYVRCENQHLKFHWKILIKTSGIAKFGPRMEGENEKRILRRRKNSPHVSSAQLFKVQLLMDLEEILPVCFHEDSSGKLTGCS